MSKLYFRYGAMNSGKSTAILQVAHNYEEKGMKILLIKPSIDTKGDRNIVSRLGVEKEVDILLTPNDTILNSMSEQLSSVFKPSAIIVDEAQFLMPLQVDELYEITKIYDIPVLCYGLRCDFQMRGFPGATRLLEISDDIEELKTICKCGKKATRNIRLINGNPVFDGKQIEIDNQDNIQYESVCGGCYLKLKRK
ncbi:thymidine kinase [bacterium]|nr:thymidine kinase [bacterium]